MARWLLMLLTGCNTTWTPDSYPVTVHVEASLSVAQRRLVHEAVVSRNRECDLPQFVEVVRRSEHGRDGEIRVTDNLRRNEYYVFDEKALISVDNTTHWRQIAYALEDITGGCQ